MSSTRSPQSSPSMSTSDDSPCASSEECMNRRVIMLVHGAREALDKVEQLVHFHSDEHRMEVKKELVDIKDKINKIYIECLQCTGGDDGEP